MRFKDYLLLENNNNSSFRFKSKGAYKGKSPLKMYSKKGDMIPIPGWGKMRGERIFELDIVVFVDNHSDHSIAKISYVNIDEPIPQVYYTYINTDTYDEMKDLLDDMFE